MFKDEELEKTMEINFDIPEYKLDEDEELEKTMEINFDIPKYKLDEDFDMMIKNKEEEHE